MQDDYAVVINTRDDVTIAVDEDRCIVGVVVQQTSEGLLLENVAVLPAAQGHSVGNALLHRAEAAARHMGHASLYLCANERMTENISHYQRIGYFGHARAEQHGHRHAFIRKTLTAS